MKTLLLLPAALLLALGACAADVGESAQSLRSCFDTGDGIVCIAGDAVDQDVNGDGQDDSFVCANAHSDSDSDSDSGENGGESSSSDVDGDVVSQDSTSDSESGSDSDEACGVSTSSSGSDSTSSSVSDLDGDGDGDGVADEVDCDCIDGGDDTPPGDTPTPPEGDAPGGIN